MSDAAGKPLVKLPELASYQIKVKLTGSARETYDEVFKQLGKIIKGLVKQDQAGTKYSQMRKWYIVSPNALGIRLTNLVRVIFSRIPPPPAPDRLRPLFVSARFHRHASRPLRVHSDHRRKLTMSLTTPTGSGTKHRPIISMTSSSERAETVETAVSSR